MNMMYNSPIVEKRSTAEFFCMRKKPLGPTIIPEMISPMIPGILNRLKTSGTRRIIKRITEKIRTEFVNGVWNS
jgi:hypothetical protein